MRIVEQPPSDSDRTLLLLAFLRPSIYPQMVVDERPVLVLVLRFVPYAHSTVHRLLDALVVRTGLAKGLRQPVPLGPLVCDADFGVSDDLDGLEFVVLNWRDDCGQRRLTVRLVSSRSTLFARRSIILLIVLLLQNWSRMSFWFRIRPRPVFTAKFLRLFCTCKQFDSQLWSNRTWCNMRKLLYVQSSQIELLMEVPSIIATHLFRFLLRGL
ncbi:hypothetical protein PMAYCL1PPCAC_32205 [Pristionchus mayeri]|uniref:Uncharacterized protein n=1 Tax=Pristionchus mayeri TaxID=1317129 RepID=A0AAN5IF64_9BILA|nr:hypothetical protein PMAYCL1PPCAC_32205 [Pristionchus mayeri]